MALNFYFQFSPKVVKCELSFPSSTTGAKLTAVKYLKDDASEQVKLSFRKEAQTVGSFDHPNIISLLGICVDDKGPPCMILGTCYPDYLSIAYKS